MQIDNIKIGDEIELTLAPYRTGHTYKSKSKVCEIYDNYILFDNGKFKFCASKFSLTRGHTITV